MTTTMTKKQPIPIEQRIPRLSAGRRKKLNARIKHQRPLCPMCMREGRIAVGVEVDHVEGLEFGGDHADGNLQALCHEHHVIKTREERGLRGKGRRTGCDALGHPLSPLHHWNKTR
jgi:hypothetical protein